LKKRAKKPTGETEKEMIIKIRAEPRASLSGIAGTYGEGLKIKLTSPPVNGKANKELIEVLAKEYGIHKRDVEIISGKNSKNKVVRLKGL
jgi:uncharacterized protein (TIGR00251 family)